MLLCEYLTEHSVPLRYKDSRQISLNIDRVSTEMNGLLLMNNRENIQHKRMQRPMAVGTVFLSAWLLAGSQTALAREHTPASASVPSVLRVDFNGGLLSIEATQRTWTEVLKEIQKKTRIRFHYAIPLEGSVTVSLTALPVKPALERLFGPDVHFVFRYPEGATPSLAAPQEVWILGTVRGGDEDATNTTAAKDPSIDPILAPDSMEDETLREAAMHAASLKNAESLDQLVETARNDQDPMKRIEALSTLEGRGKEDDSAVDSALDDAIADKDPNVRGYALQALAERKGTGATDQIRQAMEDQDPSVRAMAAGSVIAKGQGIDLLRDALADADETVRAVAKERLKEVPQKDRN
jgi:hypothetical protein